MTSLVGELGPWGVFLLMVPESACIPVPSELTLMSAGFSVSEGWMPFWAAVLAATAGNLLGSLIAYWIGRAATGVPSETWLARALSRCEGLFARHGTRAVFLARLMPLARSFVSFPAGYSGVAFVPFLFMTFAGCAIWIIAFVVLGVLAGNGWADVGDTVGGGLLTATALVISGFLLLQRRR